MNVHVFKTNLNSPKEQEFIDYSFNKLPNIKEWSVDFEDHEKVLRVITEPEVQEAELIHIVQQNGFQCEILDH